METTSHSVHITHLTTPSPGSSQSTVSSVPGATTPGPITTPAAPGSSAAVPGLTRTAAVTPSGSSAGSPGNQTGQLRPWEVALTAMASVAMAVILAAGLAASLKNCPCLRHRISSRNRGRNHQGYQRPSTTRPGFRDPSPPEEMELTGGHCA